MFEERVKTPEILSVTNILIALAVHFAFFFTCWLVVQPLPEKEIVIPIDLTLVLNENLDGEDDKPPPVANPPKPKEPEKPKPKPPPPQKIEPPKPKVPDALASEPPKTNRVEKVEKPKPKAEAPKKKSTADRIKEMQESAKVVNTKPVKNAVKNTPSDNGRTGKKTLSDKEIQKLLAQGYKPGTTEQIATGEEQRCMSLITREFYDKWYDAPAWSPVYKSAHLKFNFDLSGRVTGTQLVKSSGDANVDASIRRAASRVVKVNGLSTEFLKFVQKQNGIILEFKVKKDR